MKFDLALALPLLESTPQALDSLLRDLPAAWTGASEGAGTWSPFDVVGHLIDGEEADWIPRVRILLSDAGDRRFEPFDRFRHLSRNRGRSLGDLLQEFATLRRTNLTSLRHFRLTPTDLRRTGTHPELGVVTLEQHLATWVAHDLGHLAQVSRIMARQYTDAVGPWRAYLPILDHRVGGS
jgi:hypothetical protein